MKTCGIVLSIILIRVCMRRNPRTRSSASQDTSTGTSESITSVNATVNPVPSDPLALSDPQPQPYLHARPESQSQPSHPQPQPYMNSCPQANTPTSYASMQGARLSQNVNSFPAEESNGLAMNGEMRMSSSPRTKGTSAGQKPFVPSYRLFQDLNVLGNGYRRFKTMSSASGIWRIIRSI